MRCGILISPIFPSSLLTFALSLSPLRYSGLINATFTVPLDPISSSLLSKIIPTRSGGVSDRSGDVAFMNGLAWGMRSIFTVEDGSGELELETVVLNDGLIGSRNRRVVVGVWNIVLARRWRGRWYLYI